MIKKVLYVSRAFEDNSPVGVRFNNFKKFLDRTTDLRIINLSDDKYKNIRKSKYFRAINWLIRKIPFIADDSVLLLRKYKKTILKELNKQKFDSVIIGVLPVSFIYLPKYIKKIDININVLLDLSDPIVPHITLNRLSLFRKLFLQYVENTYLRYVDTLIVLNEEIMQYYYNKSVVKRVIVIEQGIEHNNFDNINNKFVHEKFTKNREIINLIYAGHFYIGGREPQELYKAIKASGCEIKLSVYGQFKNRFRPPLSNKFHYGGRISREELFKKYISSDIIVFIDNKDTIQIPGKTIEVLASNKPVLFIYYNYNSPTLNMIKGYEGIYVTRNNKEDIKLTIEKIIKDNNYIYNRDVSKYYWGNLLEKLNGYM